MLNFQFSGQHKFYFAYDAVTREPLRVNSYHNDEDINGIDLAGNAINVNNPNPMIAGAFGTDYANFNATGNVQDFTSPSSNNTVVITTRADAEQGVEASVIATVTKSITFTMIYKANEVSDTDLLADPFSGSLFKAAFGKKEIYAIDMDRVFGKMTDGSSDAGNKGVKGFGSNWSVGITESKPVNGVVTLDINLTSSSFGEMLVHEGTANRFIRVQDA